MRFFKRILGLIITIVSIVGMVVGFGGAFAVNQGVAIAQDSTGGVLEGVVDAIGQAETTIVTVRNTIDEASKGLETVEQSAVDVALTITSTEPVLNEVSVVLSENVPTSVEAIQLLIPNLITTTGTVDNALDKLANFNFSEALFGDTSVQLPAIDVGFTTVELPPITLPELDLTFDLGLEYVPTEGFETSLNEINDSLDGIPESMRVLSSELEGTSENLLTIGHDVAAIGDNINAINVQVALLPGQIDAYVDSLQGVKTSITDSQGNLNDQISNIGLGITVVLIWFALVQIAPLYIGLALLLGRKID